MRYAIQLPIHGRYSDVRVLAELAYEAEKAGWDGCFVWDHIHLREAEPVTDPWIVLTVIAIATERIRLGPLVTPIFRRHPWKVARETVTLDHLSKGRLILGVGLGSDAFGELTTFGGLYDDRIRAEMLDEGLAVVAGLWSGQRFSFSGKHYHVNAALFLPRPFQKPRVPIWVAGTWPRKGPFRRAARYDGVVPVAGDLETSITPFQLGEIADYVRRFRTDDRNFDFVQIGTTNGYYEKEDTEMVSRYALAGATWWIESVSPARSLREVRERILRGPPKDRLPK
jgi:alkanesulfonate monooxygenase SsuD/methylene tetrahydromethanopterin reductase-like flavin-dependent oxidoreductase (luciferase family)